MKEEIKQQLQELSDKNVLPFGKKELVNQIVKSGRISVDYQSTKHGTTKYVIQTMHKHISVAPAIVDL